MKAAPHTINIDQLRASFAKYLIHHERAYLVFLDTNILVWIFRLNSDSFAEFKNFLLDLARMDKLIIPNWVVHEYNNLLMIYSEDIFFPFKKKLKSIGDDIQSVPEIARLVSDNSLSKSKDFKSKLHFVQELESEIKSISKKIKILTAKNKNISEERREFIEDLISKSQSSVPLSRLIEFGHNYQFRLDHRIPPGFEDAKKNLNRFGDGILWHELKENCVNRATENAIFISLDVKKDWVFSPLKLRHNNKATIPNNSEADKVYQLSPWLTHEFKEIAQGEILYCNLRMLLDVLYSPDHNHLQFASYKNLAKTINIELKNNETNKIIDWLVVHDDEYSHLVNTVCSWHSSPAEVDIGKLEKWCRNNITDPIAFDRVDWSNVFVQLFI